MSVPTVRVLIIDDSHEDRTTWKNSLSGDASTPYAFSEAETAEAGLEILAREKPDCVLLDNNLPDEDGLELLPKLLSAPGCSHLPVIMLSGVGNEAVAVSAMKNGAQDYVVKGSVTPSALQKAVKYSIERVNLQLEVAFQKGVLLESEAKFKGAFENSPIGIGLLNPDRSWHDLNSAFCKMLGYSREEILSVPFRNLSTVGDQATNLQSFEDLADGTAVEISTENNYVHRDGHLVPVGVRGSVIRDSRDRVRYLMMQVLDMTDQKRAELNLKETTQKFQTLIESSPAAIVATDEALRVTLWNPASEQIFGWTENEAVGKPLPIAANKIYESQRPIFVEDDHARKDGSKIRIHSGIMPLRNDGGRVTGIMAVITDVTERARAEAALLSAREQAEAASKAKSEFLANMSHEIRTPISGVLGMTGLMLDSKLDDEQREFAENIRRSADSLLYVINNILDFSKVEAGKVELKSIDFDLEQLVRDTARSVEFSAKRKGLSFVVDFVAVPVSSLNGDPGRLRQILSNLLSNAIKFTLRGEVRLSVQELSSNESSASYRFDVVDSGVGIPEAALARMFQAFTQADASTTRRFVGTGLG